jgi:hypothetical protein
MVRVRDRVLAVALLFVSSCAGTTESGSTGTSSAAAPVAVRPTGQTSRPFNFEWAGSATAVYQVSIVDEVQRPLFFTSVRGTRLSPPADLDPVFDRGGTFAWRVALLDENDRAVAESALTDFTLGPR